MNALPHRLPPMRLDTRLNRSLALKPLALALACALPLHSLAGAPAGLAVPLVTAVPQAPSVGWRVSGTGAAAPVNTSNASGGVNQVVTQTSTTGIYNWNSFDVGANSSVTFNFPSANASALNRVTGSSSPTQIFGQLNAQYANPNGSGTLTGGTIYLINANGILFGRGAQVNVGSLIASTLDLQNSDYLSGLSNSITSTGYTFGPQTGGLPAVPTSFVQVDPGAQITTPSGGRVFLFANSLVQNGGSITTPNGQTVLAAGDQVYLNLPTNEVMYASEVNSAIPAVNGLLVEVGTGSGSVANIQGGIINTPTGNTTLVGMAVNQSGRINATTSVSQNGSVLLLARGFAQGQTGSVITKEATQTGTLTLGPTSVVDIEPDTTLGTNGQQATSNASSTFTPSLVELEGLTIEMQSGSSIVAHGGVVDARAETLPYYVPNGDGSSPPTYNYAAFTGDSARLVLDAGATIDVSGTTTTTVSAARNFVTTALLGASDLADAPLQRTGPVYRSELTFDIRSPVPILGDTSAYVNAVEKTATEQLAAGGSIKLSSTGAVVTNETSQLNVSGGAVNYTAATVTPSELISSTGTVYTFNQAPANISYVGLIGAPTGELDRWGVVPSYTPSQVSTGVLAPGYTAGMAGGSLSVVSPTSVLDGLIQANVTQGVRQTSGLDPLAAQATLNIGARTNGTAAFGTAGYTSAAVGDLDITAGQGSLGSSFWNDPLDAALPSTSRIAASTLNASGVGQITLTSNGNIAVQSGATLSLPTGGGLDLAAAGSSGIDVAANFTAAGGTFSAQTRALQGGGGDVGGVTLASGAQLNVSATWVNRSLDGAAAQAASTGGSVTLSSGGALILQSGSGINVSGGATVDVSGNVSGTAAGSITLQSNLSRSQDSDAPSPVSIGATLLGNSLVGGGALTLSADSVTIGSQPLTNDVSSANQPTGSLLLSSQWFEQGAFTQYNVNALTSLVISPGTTVQPQTSNWLATASAATEPTGTNPASFLSTTTQPVAQRLPASVTLSSASALGDARGNLTLSPGASIKTDPLASVTLNAGLALNVDGTITAPGGNVTLSLVGGSQASNPVAGTLALGAQADIDVSGQVVQPVQTGPLPTGQVLAGGSVTLGISPSAALTQIVIPAGAVINADGSSGVLGVTTTNAAGGTTVTSQTVSSTGGSISISAPNGALLAGTMHAAGGDASVSGGSFALSDAGPGGTGTIVMNQAPVTATAPTPDVNVVAVSAQSLEQGFSNVSLQAGDIIRFNSDINLALSGKLTLDAPVLSASPAASRVSLSAASTLQVGASFQQVLGTAGAIGGSTSLSLQGGLVELFGQQITQGFGTIALASASELRLESLTNGSTVQGSLGVQGNLALSAQQIVPTTYSQYSINAQGQQVLLTGGSSSATVPLSAGGTLTINATDITTINPADATQYAVLRAPFGSITLNATGSINIGQSSLLSVSGAGMTVPYGETSGGLNWSYAGTTVSAPPQKSITLNAPGNSVTVAGTVTDVNGAIVTKGATLDLSGGGNLIAQEFVPGIGGTKDIVAGAANGAFAVVPTISAYAPQDTDILTTQLGSTGPSAALQLGKDVTFGAGGPIPAGTYAVLPAQYATLPGAFLVTPTSSAAPLALGASVPQTDGSTLMGGRYVEAGTNFGSSVTQSFKVMTSALALTYSEIDNANANTYFAAQAAAAGNPVPPLPTDAGTLAIVAGQLTLKGTTLFALPTTTTGGQSVTTGLGGELDIAANAIQVGGMAPSGVLLLDPSTLNATGASLVVLGGEHDAATGTVNTIASSVTVDNSGTPLKLSDLVLTANDTVSLQANAAIQAPTSASSLNAPALALIGDGALLRVSSDPSAVVTRTGAQGLVGSLNIGSNVSLTGGAITAEATSSNTIAGNATLTAQAITLGAGHLAVGQVDPSTVGPNTLLLTSGQTSGLAEQVAGAKSLTLTSATGIDLYSSATLGSASVQSLTLDTPTIHLVGNSGNASIVAGEVTLKNTTGAAGTTASTAPTGSNQLLIQAVGDEAAGTTGTGQIVVGPGAVAITGADQTSLNANHEVVLANTAALSTSGDLIVQAAALQAQQGATASLTAGGNFTLASNGQASVATPGLGAHVTISAATINQGGQVVLPSGQLALNSTGSTGSVASNPNAIEFDAGSLTDLSGRSSSIDSITVATPGGALALNAQAGNVSIDTGATVNVSAPATGTAQAGSITISAPTGTVALRGSLLGTAAAGQGGSLNVDSNAALDLSALAATLDAAQNNFSGALTLRNRSGDQQVAAGTSLTAQNISISADNGTLTLAGSLNASGASGTQITLSGGTGLTVAATADIAAHSNGSVGSQVELESGNLQAQASGGFAGSVGSINLNGGVIDTTAATGGTNGGLLLRAQRTQNGTGVAIDGSGGTSVTGVGAEGIVIEAVKQYNSSTVSTTLITQVTNDDQTLGGTGSSNAARLLTQVGTLLGQPASALQLRAGVEVDSTGNLTMAGNTTLGGWNLTNFAANGTAQAQASGAPIDLTLRAAGNLDITGSISDGFMPSGTAPTTAAAAGKIAPAAVIVQVAGNYIQGANIDLVGGADLSAANVMTTVASAVQGDVVIGATGKNVLVRTTTGSIHIASGRDVVLLNTLADVYTTGLPVPLATLLKQGYVGNQLGTAAYLQSSGVDQSPFLTGGGSLSVNAARNIVGVDPSTVTLQYATEWAWRATDKTGGQPMWWNRYDQFQQGFATLGGGNVTASAGQDLVNADFSAAGSGFVSRDANGNVSGVVQFEAGNLNVQAGRNVLGGFVMAAGSSGTVQAGQDIATGDAPDALQVLYGNTAINVGAVNNVDLGLVSAFGLVPATKEYAATPLNSLLMGLTPDATLQVQASSGNLSYDAASPLDGSSTRLNGSSGLSETADRIVPDVASFAAPGGSITASTLIQDPAGTTKLSLLAQDNLTVSGITVNGTDPRAASPTLLAEGSAPALNPLLTYFTGLTPYDTGIRAPMELVAETGNLSVQTGILTTTQVRMIAGNDVLMGSSDGSPFQGITIQQNSASETSLIQAGQDIQFPADNDIATGGVELYGPGNLLVLAGRNIDLSTSGGLRAVGNRQNSALPAASGDITVEAGVSLAAGDYSQAAAWYFPVLGGTGIAGYAGDLVAQLTALQAGQPLPAPGSAATSQYNSASVPAQISQVQSLVGTSVFDAAVLADAQSRAPGTHITVTQALSNFASLASSDQQTVLAAALAKAWVTALPVAQQQAQVLAMAQAANSPYVAQLQQFMLTQGAPAGLSAAQALTAFEVLAPEDQALFTNQVLVGVIRQAGRTASALSGDAQTAAYAPAYAALDLVFPASSTASGSLTMGASQIETLQNSNISVLAPRGNVDVGTLVAGLYPKSADALGIVTADGGNISAVVSGSVNVDQSRVFTVGLGDLLMWASTGSLDAGRGGKTVVGAPAPVYTLNAQGQFVVDTSGSFSGSGIAVLNADSTLDLYAPKGVINAGDAGIKSLGNAYFGASSFVGADNLSVAGTSVGAPPPASTGGETAGLASVGQSATGAGTRIDAGDSDAEKDRKRRKRLNLILDFLGFGDGSSRS